MLFIGEKVSKACSCSLDSKWDCMGWLGTLGSCSNS